MSSALRQKEIFQNTSTTSRRKSKDQWLSADLAKQIREEKEHEEEERLKLQAKIASAGDSDHLLQAIKTQKEMAGGLQGELGKFQTEMMNLQKELNLNKCEIQRVEQKVEDVGQELQQPEHRTPILWLTKMRLKRLPPESGQRLEPVVPNFPST